MKTASLVFLSCFFGVAVLALPTSFFVNSGTRAQSAGVSGGTSYPPQYFTNLKAWTDDKHWVYSNTNGDSGYRQLGELNIGGNYPVRNGYLFPRLVIVGGTGWTNGIYSTDNFLLLYATGYDGSRNMLETIGFGPASPGTGGGIGFLENEYGTNKVLFLGNSLTAGLGSSDPKFQYPIQVSSNLFTSGQWWGTNAGVVAWSDYQVWTNINQGPSAWYDSTKHTNAAVVWGLTNDKFYGTNNGLALYNFTNLCLSAQSNGFTVYVLTYLSRSDSGTPGTFNTDRADLNAFLRTNFNTSTVYPQVFRPTNGVTWANYLVDVAAITAIGTNAAENNTTFFDADKVHMKDAGYTIIATNVANGLKLIQ